MKQLTPPCSIGVKQVQQSFHEYQIQAFENKPAPFFALELAGECGELANIEKKIWRDPLTDLFSSLSDEAADVFIALINYCNAREIDLELAVQNKLAVIEQRRQQGKMGKIKA